MIYCTKCGTANRRGSRFCNECGASLPTGTGLRCAMCGVMNPVSNVYCDQCNARLIPLSPGQSPEAEAEEPGPAPVKGLSLPTIPLDAEGPAAPETPPERPEEDWLAELRATVGEAAEPAAVADEGVGPVEIPDWLAGPEAARPSQETAGAEMPEWLADFEPTAEPEPTTAEPALTPDEQLAPAEAAGPPDWQAEPEPTPTPEDSTIDIPVPDWIAELEPVTPTEPEQPPPTEPSLPPEEPLVSAEEGLLPGWLAEPEAALSAPAPEEPLDEVEAAAREWLAELEAETPSRPAEEPPDEGEPELPRWLDRPEVAADAMPVEEAPEAAELPDWLAEREIPLPEAEEALPGVPVLTREEALPRAEEEGLPAWLADLAQGEQAGEPVGAILPEDAGLVPAEIPEWLEALRQQPGVEAVASDEPVEAAGLLEGLKGTLLPSPALESLPERAAAVPSAPTSAAAIARAELLQELLGRPAAVEEPARRVDRQRAGWIIQRLAVGVLLLLAILAPMVVRVSFFGSPSAPAAQRLFDVVERATAQEATVLVAFEYGPAEADEMDQVAKPILDHLLQRGARLAIVSTRPEGPAVADELLAELIPDEQVSAARVVRLGYQPGQAAGVQALLAGLGDRAQALEGVRTAADLTMVLVLAAQPSDLRTWVEQSSLGYAAVPRGAGISARAEPLAAPYADPRADQLDGMVAGLTGAAVYEASLGSGGRADLYDFYLNSLGAAQLAVVGLMFVGALIFLTGGQRR
jgi:hypothetical protein